MNTANPISNPISRNRQTTTLYYLCAVGLACIPVILTVLVLMLHMRVDLRDFLPAEPNDSLFYWRQTAAFQHVGFNGGYYTWAEQPAAATFSHFGAWGPWFAMLTGSLARVFGWSYASQPLYHLGLLILSVLLLAASMPRSWRLLGVLGMLLAVYYPISFHLVSGMQEIWNHAIALALAALITLTFKTQPPKQRVLIALTFGVIVLASFVRLTWALLLFPYTLIALRHTSHRWQIVGVVSAIILTLLLARLYLWSVAPNFVSGFLTDLQTNPAEAPALLLAHISENVQTLTIFSAWGLTAYGMIALMLIVVVTLILLWRGANRLPQMIFGQVDSTLPFELLFHGLNLGAMFALSVLFYEGIGGYFGFRVLAPHLFLSLALLIARRRLRPVLAFVVISLLFSGSFLDLMAAFRRFDFQTPPVQVTAFQQEITSVVQYDADAPNAWCNTLLIKLGDRPGAVYAYELPVPLLGLPAGIGISFLMELSDLNAPPKSRYLMMSEASLIRLTNRLERRQAYTLNTRLLATTSVGTLYENLDADCDH